MTTLYHKSLEGDIPFTEEEEAEYYAREAAWIPDYTNPTQQALDKAANLKGYDHIQSAVSYVGDPNQTYNNEGIAFRDWRSDVWSTHNALLAGIQNGDPKISVDEFLALLPHCPI